MSTFAEQLQAFAKARGGTLRHGPQPPKPDPTPAPCIGRPRPAEVEQIDPCIEFTDDYSLWARTRRGER